MGESVHLPHFSKEKNLCSVESISFNEIVHSHFTQ